MHLQISMCLYIALKYEKIFDLLSVFQTPHNNTWLQETDKTVKFTLQGPASMLRPGTTTVNETAKYISTPI